MHKNNLYKTYEQNLKLNLYKFIALLGILAVSNFIIFKLYTHGYELYWQRKEDDKDHAKKFKLAKFNYHYVTHIGWINYFSIILYQIISSILEKFIDITTPETIAENLKSKVDVFIKTYQEELTNHNTLNLFGNIIQIRKNNSINFKYKESETRRCLPYNNIFVNPAKFAQILSDYNNRVIWKNNSHIREISEILLYSYRQKINFNGLILEQNQENGCYYFKSKNSNQSCEIDVKEYDKIQNNNYNFFQIAAMVNKYNKAIDEDFLSKFHNFTDSNTTKKIINFEKNKKLLEILSKDSSLNIHKDLDGKYMINKSELNNIVHPLKPYKEISFNYIVQAIEQYNEMLTSVSIRLRRV